MAGGLVEPLEEPQVEDMLLSRRGGSRCLFTLDVLLEYFEYRGNGKLGSLTECSFPSKCEVSDSPKTLPSVNDCTVKSTV